MKIFKMTQKSTGSFICVPQPEEFPMEELEDMQVGEVFEITLEEMTEDKFLNLPEVDSFD